LCALRVQLTDAARRQFWAFDSAQDTNYRLFCFPYGGGGASVYQAWTNKIVPTAQLCPIQLPGREDRHAELPITQFDWLIATLVEVLAPLLDNPFAFYGHSLGGLSAFEVTRELRRLEMPLPMRVFISGCRDPRIPQVPHLRSKSDKDFLSGLEQLFGDLPSAIRSDPEMMPFFLRVLILEHLVQSKAFANQE
jgi:medium-chain acyl-[acyl-carrier-protein] hydrolase